MYFKYECKENKENSKPEPKKKTVIKKMSMHTMSLYIEHLNAPKENKINLCIVT